MRFSDYFRFVAGGRRRGAQIGVESAGRAVFSVADQLRTPVPSLPAGILPLDSLSDICGWLGTYRERLRVARSAEPEERRVPDQWDGRPLSLATS